MTAKLQKRSESPQRDLEWTSDLWPKTSLPLFNSIRNENRNRNHHKLGFFNKLLEEGCAEFSNIEGLEQIRFPKGNIGTAFEKIRGVLEREGIIPKPNTS